MSNPYVGEIRMFAGNFAPAGWAFCNGALMPIAENDTLFNLIGTTYGGDGQTTFGLPDLQGRVPIHQGNGLGLSPHVIGEKNGSETVTLTTGQMPPHSHALQASSAQANGSAGPGGVLASSSSSFYGSGTPNMAMAAQAITPLGGSHPHDNMAPFLTINYIISLFGIFPSQT